MIAWGVKRVAGALFADDEPGLSPESVVAEAAKGARLDATPLADPHLIEALGALTSSLRKDRKSVV